MKAQVRPHIWHIFLFILFSVIMSCTETKTRETPIRDYAKLVLQRHGLNNSSFFMKYTDEYIICYDLCDIFPRWVDTYYIINRNSVCNDNELIITDDQRIFNKYCDSLGLTNKETFIETYEGWLY